MGVSGDPDELRGDIAERAAAVREVAGATDESSIRKRARSLWQIAEDLMLLKEYSEAALRFREAEPLLWRLESETERELAVHACGRRAVALLSLGRLQEALDVLQDLMRRVALDWVPPDAVPGSRTADLMPIAVGPWLEVLEGLGRFDEALIAADTLIEAFDPPATEVRRYVVATAFRMKGMVAEKLQDDAEALAFFDEALRHAAREKRKALVWVVADCMVRRASLLERAGRTEDAAAVYDEVLARCETSTDPTVVEVVSNARTARAKLSRRSWRRILKP